MVTFTCRNPRPVFSSRVGVLNIHILLFITGAAFIRISGTFQAIQTASRRLIRTLLDILHGEGKSAHLVFSEADNCDLVTERQHILNMVDPVLCNLGDVDHAFLAGSELDECTEVLDGHNSPLKDLTLLEVP